MRAPAETLACVTPHLAAMGITRIATITGLDRVGLPVVAVYRPNARSVAVSQGKGIDLAAAKASGVMEAIESHHAEHPDLALRLTSEHDLRAAGHAVVATQRLPRLSVSRFDARTPILWCAARDLMAAPGRTAVPLWVPFEMVHTNYTRPLPAGSGHFQMSSNGLASGNHPLEAIGHGLCEVIERDALALWALRGGTDSDRGRLDLDTVDDPTARDLLARLAAADLAVGVWDITTDVGVPVFVCALADRTTNHLGQVYSSHGSGCHPARAIALCRALTEAAQTRLTYIAGTRDDAHRTLFETARNPDRVAAVRARLETPPQGAGRAFAAVPSHETLRFDDDVTWILARLAAVGITQAAVVTVPARIPGIAVVRVIVPGLEGLHDAPGYVRGERAMALARDRADGGAPAA
nr:YcaO-like family protein [Roseospira goensis]